MKFIIHIKDQEERLKFAQDVRKLVEESTTYIPRLGKVIKCDIGIKSTVNPDQLASIIALIERRGYTYNQQ